MEFEYLKGTDNDYDGKCTHWLKVGNDALLCDVVFHKNEGGDFVMESCASVSNRKFDFTEIPFFCDCTGGFEEEIEEAVRSLLCDDYRECFGVKP